MKFLILFVIFYYRFKIPLHLLILRTDNGQLWHLLQKLRKVLIDFKINIIHTVGLQLGMEWIMDEIKKTAKI